MPTPDIFLSYNREDAGRARLFAEAFAAEGFDVWWDAQLRSGDDYDKVTEDALKGAKAVVVLWSLHSVDSRWVRAEATLAQRNKTLMPAMIEPCERPVMFELTHTAELAHWNGDSSDPAWRGFVADLRKMTGKDLAGAPSVAPSQAQPAPRPARKRHVLIAFAALAVLAVVGVLYVTFGGSAGGGLIGSQSEKRVPVLVRAFKASGTGDQNEAAMASGITDELINRLRRIPGLQIGTARADGTTDSTAFASAYIVEGNIRSRGDQLRVTAKLTKPDGEIAWSETFDRKLVDLFSVQESIAANIAGALSVSLDVGANSADYGGTNNPEAYAAYMQSFAHSIDPDPTTARRYLERAVALDPNFVKAWFGLGAISEPGRATTVEEANRLLEERDKYTAKALAANPNIWLGHNARGGYELARKNLPAAEQYFARSAEFDRGDDPQLRTYPANYAIIVGRVKKGAAIRRSNEIIDPIHRDDPWKVYDFVMLGQYRDAIDLYSRLARGNPEGLAGFARWAFYAHLLSGTEAEAVRFARQGGPDFEEELRNFAAAKTLPGLSDSELEQAVAGLSSVTIGNRAVYVAYGGHPELALKLMRKALEKPGGTILLLLWHPAFAEARKTPEFERLVADLGLVKVWQQSGDWGDFCQPETGGGITCH